MLSAWLVAGGSIVVGVLGGALGVGGGMFLVPFLVWAGLRPVEAVGVSLFCVIGTSTGASSVGLRNGEANLGLSLVVEPGLIVGAVLAGMFAYQITGQALMLSFSGLLAAVTLLFLRKSGGGPVVAPSGPAQVTDGASDGHAYRPQRLGLVAALSVFAGAASGLFGIGGGIVTVPLFAHVGRVPVRAAAATASVSLMTSAGAGAAVHLAHGTFRPDITAAAFFGVLVGSLGGARLQKRLPESALRVAFVLLSLGVAISTAWQSLGLGAGT